jgi:small subunit ribosomal protein S20
MAHHKSAIKRICRNARHARVNTARVSRLRTSVRKVEEAIAGGNKEAAAAALKAAQPELQRSASRNLVHANAAARKISRLSARIKAMSRA